MPSGIEVVPINNKTIELFRYYIEETDLDKKAIGEKLGYKPTAEGVGGNLRKDSPIVKAYEAKYGKIPVNRFKESRLNVKEGIGKKIVQAFDKQIKNFGVPNISQIVKDVYGPGKKDFDGTRRTVRKFLAKPEVRNYKGKANIPVGDENLSKEDLKSKARKKKLKAVDDTAIGKFMAAPADSGLQYHHTDATKTSPVTLKNVSYVPAPINNYLQKYEGPIAQRKKEINRLIKNKPEGYKKLINKKLMQIRNQIAKSDLLLKEKGFPQFQGLLEVDTFDINGKPIKIGGGGSLKLGNDVITELGLDPNKPLKQFTSEERIQLKKAKNYLLKQSQTNITSSPEEFLKTLKTLYKSEPKGSPFRKTMENVVNCADGCFIKVANANPTRVAKQVSNNPKLIRLFRGESFPQRNIKSLKDTAKQFGTTLDEIKKDSLSGQWFTPNQRHASSYLAKPGRMKYVDVTPAELESFNKYKERVNKRPVKYSAMKVEGLPNPPTHGVTTSEFHQIIPRYKLKQMEDAGRLKTKYDLNPFTKRYVSAGDSELIKSTAGVLEYDDVLGGFVDSANPSEIVGQNQIKAWAADNPMPVKAGTAKPGMLRKTGRALAHVGLPLPTAALDTYFIGKQIQEGRDPAEIAKDPFNWLGLATMEPLTKAAGVADKSGKLASVMRLGMSPGMIRGATRFLGLPGLAISTALTAYDQYKKYQDKEGFIYDLFNKEDVDTTSV